MRQFHNLTKAFLMTGICFLLGACSGDNFIEEVQEETLQAIEPTRHTMPMEFIGNVVGFDQQSSQTGQRRSAKATSSWKNGDKVFITFYNGSTIIPGEATYSSTDGWQVTYDGNLEKGTGLKCEARYFVGYTTTSSSSQIYLDATSEIYEDIDAKYDFEDNAITVQATMTPKTGRVRFTGKSGETIYVRGITFYNTFTTDNNKFTTSKALVKTAVASNGSTPYIYGTFAETDHAIGMVTSTSAFTRTCPTDMLKTGDSGYMAIPTESAHGNWRSGLYLRASGVEFKMIPVVGYSEGFFLIGETEVTEALYNTVNGTTSTSMLPISNVTYSTISPFCQKLTAETNLKFALPNKAQWQYAARGGNQSKGYTYSGSNDPDVVAWYTANSSAKQTVKTKSPNELGIYDMSGNVQEFVTTMYNSSGYYHPYRMGGSYYNDESFLETTHAGTYATNSNYAYNTSSCKWAYTGFRVIATCE